MLSQRLIERRWREAELFRAIDTRQIEWASCLGFVAKVLNASGNQIHLHIPLMTEEQGEKEPHTLREVCRRSPISADFVVL